MLPHHSQSIQNVREYFERDPEVLALLLSGSIAHGFQSATSDVDIMIFVSEEDHRKRSQTGQLHFFNRELCTYEGGYVDGKYLSLNFVKQVLEKGSEPARFAFEEVRFCLAEWKVLKRTSAKSRNILFQKKRTASNAFMPSSKPGTGTVVKHWPKEIDTCLGHPSAN